MEKDEKKYDLEKLKLRDDDPVDEDQFKDETHDQVANTLVKLLTEKDGGFAIGLEGSWGSGKSTVAKITEQKIEDSTKEQNRYVFFTFDTWAHQGDPIRRSFLECLAGKLFKKEIINKRKWYRHVSNIRASEKKINTTSKPNVPFFSYIMAFYALVAPFILFWAHSEVSDGEITDAWLQALIFVGFPIITAFFTWIIRNKCELKTKGLPVLPTFRYLKHEMTTEQSIKTKDATTIEFNDHFDRLIKDLAGKSKQLVVILDNLDRVSSDEFISMWGTMRNFFTADKESERDKLLRNVYLIVPFDQEHINEIFNKSVDKDPDNEQLIGEEFVDKTFRFVLDVAPPIVTNWKSFIDEELKESFGDPLYDQERHDLKKLFDLYHQRKNKSITPRRIKTFINDLILQLYERNGEIPLKYLALYVLYKNEIKSNPNGIITKEIFNQRTIDYFEGEDWIQNVAAAHYKVTPKKALQLVLGNRIISALVNNENKELAKLQEHFGFSYALTKVISDNAEELAKSEPISFAKMANTFGRVELNNEPLENEIWKILAVNTKHVKSFLILNEIIGLGLANIISNAPFTLVDKSINQICSKVGHNNIEDVTAEKYSNDFFEFLLELSSSIVNRVGNEKSKRYLSKIKLPDHSKTLLHLASHFYNIKEIQFDSYDLNPSSSKNIQEELINSIEKLSLDVIEKSLVTFYRSKLPLNWNTVADKLNNRLLQNKVLESHEYESLISMLTFLKFENTDKAQTHVTNLTKSGFLLGVFNKSGDKEKLKAILVFYYLAHYKKVEKVNIQNNVSPFGRVNANKFVQIFNSPDEYSDLVDQLADLIKNYNQLRQLMKMISENPNKNELLIKVFKKLIVEGYLKGLDVIHILNYYSGLNLDSDEQYFNRFFELLDEQNLDVDKIDSLDKIKEEVLKASITSDSKFGSSLYGRCIELFSNLNEEDWLKEIKSEGHVLKLVNVLVELDRKSFIKRVDFRNALRDYNNEVLFNNNKPKKFSSDDWTLLPNAMSKTNRESFYKLLYNDLISEYRTSEISFNVLKHYGDEFIEALDPTDRPDKFVEHVFLDLINSNVEERNSWVFENTSIVKSFLSNSNEVTQSKIKDAVNSSDAAEEGDINSIIEVLEHK